MLNRIDVMGRLVAAPELKQAGDLPVCNFRIACERDYSGRGEERKTDFFEVVAWRGTAEFISKYFQKGSMIIVSGRLQQRSWTDKDGNKRSTVEIVADQCYFGSAKGPMTDVPDVTPADRDEKVAQQRLDDMRTKFTEIVDDESDLPF